MLKIFRENLTETKKQTVSSFFSRFHRHIWYDVLFSTYKRDKSITYGFEISRKNYS